MTEFNHPQSMLDAYSTIPRGTEPWSQPEMFDLSNGRDQVLLEDRLTDGAVTRIHDPLPELAQALCEYEDPTAKANPSKRQEYYEHVASKGDEFGTWVLFPWSGVLSRFPDKEDLQKLRTSRNRNFITAENQATLLDKRVAVLGLSVGSKALSALVEGGIGGSYIIGDADYLDPTNINRIDAGYTEVGSAKIDIAAKKISEKDPYVEQIHLKEGMRHEDGDVLGTADLIVEEVDNLSIKALCRLIAHKYSIPLVMAADIDTTSVIDVERYDIDKADKIMFDGRISRAGAEDISSRVLNPPENMKYMLKHVGVRHLTAAMMESAMLLGTELGGLPQLGMTATKGGAEVAFAAREILLGHRLPSGRYAAPSRKTFGLSRDEVSLPQTIQTARTLMAHFKEMAPQD